MKQELLEYQAILRLIHEARGAPEQERAPLLKDATTRIDQWLATYRPKGKQS